MPLTQMLLASFGDRRLRQPRLLAARPRRRRRLRRRPLGERALPEAGRGRAPARALGSAEEQAEGGLRPARSRPRRRATARSCVVCREVLGLRRRSGEGGLARLPRRQPRTRCCGCSCACWPRARRSTDTLARIDRRQLERRAREPQGARSRALPTRRARSRARCAGARSRSRRSAWRTSTRATNNLAVVDAELERIEQQVRLVREESAVSRSPEALSARLDAVSVDAQRDLALDGPARRPADRLPPPTWTRRRPSAAAASPSERCRAGQPEEPSKRRGRPRPRTGSAEVATDG